MTMTAEVVKRLAVKQALIRRRVVAGRRRRGGVWLLLCGRLTRWLGRGKGQKNVQNGIRTKNISITTSAGPKKKEKVSVTWFNRNSFIGKFK